MREVYEALDVGKNHAMHTAGLSILGQALTVGAVNVVIYTYL